MSISTKSVSLVTEAENLNDEDGAKNVKVGSEVRGVKRSKRTVNKSGDEGKAVQLGAVKTIATKKLLVKSAEVSGALNYYTYFTFPKAVLPCNFSFAEKMSVTSLAC